MKAEDKEHSNHMTYRRTDSDARGLKGGHPTV
jgi:hypothetical protein